MPFFRPWEVHEQQDEQNVHNNVFFRPWEGQQTNNLQDKGLVEYRPYRGRALPKNLQTTVKKVFELALTKKEQKAEAVMATAEAVGIHPSTVYKIIKRHVPSSPKKK